MLESRLARRGFLAGAGATLGLAASGALRPASAACSEVVVSTWGGDYQKFLQQFVEPPLKGKVEVLHDVTRPAERKTKLLAERNSRRGNMDVVHLNGPDVYEMQLAGVVQKLDPAQISNWKDIDPQFADEFSIPHIYSAQTILYNPEHVKPAPTSYDIFWDPKYKGRVGIQRHLWVNWFEIAGILGGGSATNYEPGLKLLQDLKKNEPRIYPSQETLAVAIRNGEVWLTPNWRARAYMWRKDGMPIQDAVPKEGAVPIIYRGIIAKNAPNAECGYRYLNAMLEPGAQMGFAENMGYLPTVTDAKLPEELQKAIGFTEAEKKNFFKQDYDYIAKNFAPWGEWWQKNFLV